MADPNRYTMLLTSLPYHGPLFGSKQTPLSRIRLNQRLKLLQPEDARILAAAWLLMDAPQQQIIPSDQQVVAHARRVLSTINHAFVRDLVIWRLELRTVLAALRRRHHGRPAPTDDHWGFGRWVPTIRRQWKDPGFGLDTLLPWITPAKRLLERDETLELERLIISLIWNHLERLSDGHYFDFEAVVLYVARWELIARWTTFNPPLALERFDQLAEHALLSLHDVLRHDLPRL